ncbi:MAG TPA: amino acid racemase [Clostridia bacterium]|nr:amino acid racemase [Clostridia bacterium]
MRTIGIVGGMGPLAAARLFERIVVLTKANSDNEHIPMIIDNNTNIPDRTESILNNGANPIFELVRSALKLEMMGADVLIMACNTAHYYYDEIIKFVRIPMINMVEETAKYIKSSCPSARRIGLLATEGTCKSGIYTKVFEKSGMEIVIPERSEQEHITALIYDIKKGRGDIDPANVIDVVSALKHRGAEVIVLGCTELPLAVSRFGICSSYVDSSEVLAMSAIAYAGKDILYEKKDSSMQ